jgi:hypothetical protein
MSCENGQDQISSFVDQDAASAEVRQALQALSRPVVPPALSAQLRVIASHERQRRLVRLSIASFARHCGSQFRLAFDNMMRPVAIPFAGGSLSSIVLFAMLVPCLSFPHHFGDGVLSTGPEGTIVVMGSTGEYVPDAVVDTPRLERASATSPDDANVVSLTIDERGRVSDYSLERGRLTPDLQSIIMFSQFTPATVLGVPTSAKVKVVQRPPARRHLRS